MKQFSPEALLAAKNKIILPLDVNSIEQAEMRLRKFASHVGMVKIGLEAINAIGGPIMTDLVKKHGGKIFYDIKLNDIPNTVAGASKAISEQEVAMFNVHASAGFEAIKAAVSNAGNAKVLVVTILTSIPLDDCQELFGNFPDKKVVQFSKLGAKAGAHGIICSPLELQLLAQSPDLNKMLRVIPGIQPSWMQKNDQKRTMTPYEAIKAGADYLVIGRAITAPDKDGLAKGDSMKAIELITEEIAKAMEEMNTIK